MKLAKMLLVGVFAFGALLLTGCSDSPSDVTKKTLKAIVNNDKKALEKYCTPEIVARETKTKTMTKEEQEWVSKIKIVKEEINGDKATVTVSLMVGNTEHKSKVYLEKINGKWIIVK